MHGDCLIIKGTILYAPAPDVLSVHPASYLAVRDGVVTGLFAQLPPDCDPAAVVDYGAQLVIPGFVDLHTHAAQFFQRGLGLDKPLLDWLKHVTFPQEAKLADPAYAQAVYAAFAAELLRQGTTRAAVYGSVHSETVRLLAKIMTDTGLGAYVGKVNMDCHCPPRLREATHAALQDTEALLADWPGGPLVKPILTPRFAPVCSRALLAGLGELAQRYQAPVQSHLAETRDEAALVKQLFPEFAEYHEVYAAFGLFGQTPTLMAHCIYVSDAAIACMRAQPVMAVHCPDSNLNLGSGVMPARKLLAAGVPVGLGTDVGAGHTLSMRQAIIRAVQLSKLPQTVAASGAPLSLAEAFYLATKGGGSFFGKVGSFEPGYSFDALVVAPERPDLAPEEALAQFIYADRAEQIVARYVAGRKL